MLAHSCRYFETSWALLCSATPTLRTHLSIPSEEPLGNLSRCFAHSLLVFDKLDIGYSHDFTLQLLPGVPDNDGRAVLRVFVKRRGTDA